MSYHETGVSRVSSMREVQAILYEYREEDIQIPYLLAECVDYLLTERDRLREALDSAYNLLSEFTTGDSDDPIDIAVDILSTALGGRG